MVIMHYWLMKSEPDVFGIADLERVQREEWDGVRNYQARNFMRDDMRIGDRVLFYHSNAKPSGVAGIAEVVGESRPDQTSWDPKSSYYDPKSSPDAPRWFMVELGFVESFGAVVPLAHLREIDELADMALLNRSRLSVQPVTKAQFQCICGLAQRLS